MCDNYNLKLHRRSNNMSRVNFSGYVGHGNIFSCIACYLVVALDLGLGLEFVPGW